VPFAWRGRCSHCLQNYRINLALRDNVLWLVIVLSVLCLVLQANHLLAHPYGVISLIVISALGYVHQRAKPEPDSPMTPFTANPARLCCPNCQAPTIARWRMAKAMVPLAWYGRCRACRQGYQIHPQFRDLLYALWWLSLFALIRYSMSHHLNTPLWMMLIPGLAIVLMGYLFGKPHARPLMSTSEKIVIGMLSLLLLWIVFHFIWLLGR